MSIAYPGYVATVATGGPVQKDWGNAIRDRALQVFADTTTRDAAIPSPLVGQLCYIGTTGLLLQYAGAVDGWRAPWNTDWGNVGAATATSTQSGITTITDLTSLTVTFTAVANRRYKVWGTVFLGNSSAVQNTLTLADGSNVVKQTWAVNIPVINNVIPLTPTFVVLGLAAGSTTLKFRLSAPSGAASSNASATLIANISVDDDGPNGNPS